MKLPTPSRGSFGIPEEVHPDNLRRKREEVAEAMQARSGGEGVADPEFSSPSGGNDETEEEDGETAASPPVEAKTPKQLLSPLDNLRAIGVELTPEDFHRLVFKGFIEKQIKISINPITREPVLGTFRTLTPGNYDELDECLAEECADLRITREGAEQRRSSWTMAFSLTAIDGRPFVKPVMKKDPDLGDMVDAKATAKLRKKYIRELNTQLVNRALKIFDILTANLTIITEDPEATFFAKP